MNTRIVLASAFAAALAVPALLSAQKPADMPSFKAEKCYGIAKAGHNDCASAGNNSCAGTSSKDGERAAWIYVPAGTCSKIVGASMSAS